MMTTESFLPTLNGVTTSVCRVAESLRDQGHECLIVAPAPAPREYAGARVHRLPRLRVRQFPVGVPTTAISQAIIDWRPDVVHAASPFVVSARALSAARARDVPSVAIYQTDMPSYLAQHSGPFGEPTARMAWAWVRRMHSKASLNLAPSTPTIEELRAHGIPRVALWRRGVDTTLFRPELRDDRRTHAMRRILAPDGEVLIGYVGRLAPEKEVERLTALAHLPGTRLVIVGDGPSRADLGAALTRAVASSPRRPNRPPIFLGYRSGEELALAYAAFDVFVHTGTKETFGQTLQEAAATGLPVVAPAAGGPLDLVRPGVTGELFDPGDPADLTRLVEPLVHDAGRRRRLGTAAHVEVATRSWDALTRELVEHYERAIAAG